MPILTIVLAWLAAPISGATGTAATQDTQTPLLSAQGAVDAACAWLFTHQDDDGHWDSAGFMKHDAEGPDLLDPPMNDDEFWERALAGDETPEQVSETVSPGAGAGAGDPRYDIGVTSLALLALMADGHTAHEGGHQAEIARGLDWLVSRQDPGTGLIGNTETVAFHYEHAIATLALGTALEGAPDAVAGRYRLPLVHAVRYIASARNPYGAWRYASPPDGDSDTSVTAWMTLALVQARDAGIDIDADALNAAASWFEQMTDPDTGRVGYTERGSRSARIPGVNDWMGQAGTETLTAGALLAQLAIGADPRENAALVQNVRLMLDALENAPADSVPDAVWVHWGTQAMSRIKSLPWSRWSAGMTPSLMQSQSREGATAGSWAPVGVWGHALGRVGTTALVAHALATVEREGAPGALEAPPSRVVTRAPVYENVQLGLAWLASHQEEDGSWNPSAFADHDPTGDRSTGAGEPHHEVGVTGLALLAFLGDGHSMVRGDHKDVVIKGFKWLVAQQNRDTGLFGDEVGQAFLYSHAIATLAVCEAYYLDKSIILKGRAQKAVNYILRARNPYGVWRYDSPPNGDNDTSITAWMMQVVRSADDAGLKVDRESWVAARQWLDEMTDEGTGRVGYTERGSTSSRVPGMNDWFPTDQFEALTAAGLYTRFLAGEAIHAVTPVMQQHADLVVLTKASLENPKIPMDAYALYYSTRAMYQMGGSYWEEWSKALRSTIIETQCKDGAARGSWDPNGPWGYSGGRVYSTAMMVLNALMLKRDDELMR